MQYLHPDGTPLVIWRDPARTAAEIRRFSPDDARAYLELAELLSAFLAIAVPAMRTDVTRPAASARSSALRARWPRTVDSSSARWGYPDGQCRSGRR